MVQTTLLWLSDYATRFLGLRRRLRPHSATNPPRTICRSSRTQTADEATTEEKPQLAGIVCVVKGGERLQPEPGVVVDDADPETAQRSPIAIAM